MQTLLRNLIALAVAATALSAASGLSAQQLTPDLGSLATIRTGVKSKRVSSYDKTGANDDRLTNILPGQKRTIADISGAGIINHIWITIAPPKIKRNDIVLRMYWDGNTKPSVEAPISAFFGQGWNESYTCVSLPISATPKEGRALVCYFPMPFAKGARIEIENQSTTEKISAFYYYVDYVEVEQLPAGLGRFHAWYNYQITEAPKAGENEWSVTRPMDLNPKGENNYVIADITGHGHFVGVNYYVNCPSPMWYGEGDDMIFIDGSPMPTLNGTGTEDYFNTGWCPKDELSHPFFGYGRVTKESGFLGRTHCYRYHINDPIYFDKSLRFTIEHGHANGLTLELASVAYWYQDTAVGVKPIVKCADRQPKPIVDSRSIFRWRDSWRKANGNKPELFGDEK